MHRGLRFFILASMLFTFIAAPSARAASILLELWTFGSGNLDGEPVDTWKLMASATSASDNDGMAGYNIDLININSATNLRPRILNGGTPVQGFIVGGADLAGDGALFAGQDSTDPTSILYHVAEPGFNGPNPSPLVGENVPWGLPPILLASGIGPWQLTDFGASTNVNVWSEGEAALIGTAAEAALVSISVVRHGVPEPSLFVFAAAGVLAYSVFRRHR